MNLGVDEGDEPPEGVVLQRGAVPASAVRGGLVGGAEELGDRAVGIGRGAGDLVGQQELLVVGAVVRAVGADRLLANPSGAG